MISTQYISRISLNRDKVVSFDHYPFSIPAIRSFDFITPHPNVTFFIGENGTGKSTLLEAIAVSMGFNPEGGTRNFQFQHPGVALRAIQLPENRQRRTAPPQWIFFSCRELF
nr:AAA family ATPase [Dickeya sp. NCPPB 3274]